MATNSGYGTYAAGSILASKAGGNVAVATLPTPFDESIVHKYSQSGRGKDHIGREHPTSPLTKANNCCCTIFITLLLYESMYPFLGNLIGIFRAMARLIMFGK